MRRQNHNKSTQNSNQTTIAFNYNPLIKKQTIKISLFNSYKKISQTLPCLQSIYKQLKSSNKNFNKKNNWPRKNLSQIIKKLCDFTLGYLNY